MGQKETKLTDLCSELAITRQTLYRRVALDGTLRKDGLKVDEGGKIRYGKHLLPRFVQPNRGLTSGFGGFATRLFSAEKKRTLWTDSVPERPPLEKI